RIKPEELKDRGDTEVVSILYPLETLNAEDIAPEVQKMMWGPFSKITVLGTTNTLLLQGTAEMLKVLDGTLKFLQDQQRGDTASYHRRCKYSTASQAAQRLRDHLGDQRQEVTIVGGQGKEQTKRVKTRFYNVSFDEASNTVFITGSAAKVGQGRD